MIIRPTCRLQEFREQVGALRDGMVGEDENQAQPEEFASVFHSLWWAFVTMTTVGYGDVVPITLGGRLFTCLFVLISLGVVSAPAGMLASALMKARQME